MQDYKIEPSFSEDYHIYVIGEFFEGNEAKTITGSGTGKENAH